MEGIIEHTVHDKDLIEFEDSVAKINKLVTEGLNANEISLLLNILGSTTKSTKKTSAKVDNVLKKLAGIKQLRKDFKIVEIDKSAKRTLKLPPGHRYNSWADQTKKTIDVPLIWAVRLPIRDKVVVKNIGGIYQVTTTAPNPCKEAMEQLAKHASKFDHCECWWVPNSFNIEKKPKPKTPDPILVGAITIPVLKRKYYFELHRWIDETVETGWWSLEGY